MASLSEIIQLCRLCLVKDHVNISIFDDPENVRQIPLKISSCLPVKISRDDNLPKKICDGCSSKLDLCYDFWTSTAQAEKTLLCMAKEKENQVPEAVIPQPLLLKVEPAEELLEETQICEPPVPKPIIVKKEVEPAPTSVENEAEEPAAKRPRRSAAIKAQMQIAPESDDDDAAEGLGTTEDVADVEDDIEDPDIPDMNVEIDDVKPGPSGLNQRSADSELNECAKDDESDLEGFEVVDATVAEPNQKITVRKLRGSIPQSVIYCPNCGQHCQNYNDYDKHILENPSHQSFDCFQCKKHFESLPDLKQHVEKAHLNEKFPAQGVGYFCHFCGTKEMSIKKLDTHIHKDHVKRVLECTMCSRFYKNPRALYNHFEIVHAVINNVDFFCDQCDHHFYDPEIYTLHMNKYHKVEIKSLTYQCVLCTKKLKEINEFLQHVHKHGKYTESSEKMTDKRPAFVVWSRQCFICSKVVQDRTELTNHLMDVHFNSKICPLCNVKVKGSVELHLRQVHSLSLDINLLKGENDQRYIPFVISAHKNKRLANPATEKICEVCYGVVPKKAFFQHMAMHKNQGTDQLKSQNPVLDTVPNQSQLTFCKTCRLRVVTTFMRWHKNIHKKQKPAKKLRSRSPVRPRNRSRPRTSMKCTECDRSYDTVENLVNHVKAQHFAVPVQPSSYHPYMTVPMEFQGEPFGFQNPIPDVNTLSQPRSSDRTNSARSRRDFRNHPKF